MHSPATALETLEFLWSNLHTLRKKVDIESLSHDDLTFHIKRNTPVRPFRIATWHALQAYFIAAWSLWEYYARGLCQQLPKRESRRSDESTVSWVARSLAANQIAFSQHKWFSNASALRNLIAHNGARVDDKRSQRLLTTASLAFPGLGVWQDGYIEFTHEQMADVQLALEDFFRDTARLKLDGSCVSALTPS